MAEEKTDLDGLRNPEFWKEYHHNVQSQIEKINSLLKDLWTASENPPRSRFADEVRLRQAVGRRRWACSRTSSPRGGSRWKTGFPIRCRR